ncbi:hypothetical protein [Acetonema longum]|uniref:Uncharacterized protein n=1 Tax=Acetonema longum DSM 6540 TaxID=1009370 RepID=F7NHZ9_9FIRM|nr:hypothetical protein [Acetonema longum]EGO64334.1 hypothetical protein ALO_08485 [Acetonema longum DSM 6540]
MDKASLRRILSDLIAELLTNQKTKEQTIKELAQRVDIVDVLDSKDDLIINGYYALKYLTDDYETTVFELIYLNDCFIGSKQFSEAERNRFIEDGIKSENRSNKG